MGIHHEMKIMFCYLQRILESLCKNMIDLEDELNRLDAGSGDGDCGSTMAYGAKGAIKGIPKSGQQPNE